jgi:3-hydroxyacyl-[acyl-carrier-protein] dehydratase
MHIDSGKILNMLPHRPPFLFLDRIVDVVPGKSGTGIKAVTRNERGMLHCRAGGLELPGVLILELMAQTTALILRAVLLEDTPLPETYRKNTETTGGAGYLVGADTQFLLPVRPGDILCLYVDIIKRWGRFVMAEARATVDGREVATAAFTLATS